MRLRHLDTSCSCMSQAQRFALLPGEAEGSWKEQEGLDEENIWAAPLAGLHCVFKRRVSSIRTPIICGCPVREAQKPERHLLLLPPPPPPPLLSLSFPISLSVYYRQHLQPFYAGRSQSCRERCSLVTCAQPAAAAAAAAGRPGPAKMVKRKSLDENEPECGKGIPFPIQTFLWRQTRFGVIH